MMAQRVNKGHKKAGVAEAIYDATNADELKATVKALHVLLCQEGGAWSAQGVEIDYAASGASIEEATKNFGEGLVLTVMQHLAIRGNLDKVLMYAPQEILNEWAKTPPAEIKQLGFIATAKVFKEANIPKPEEAAKKFPFEVFQFVAPKPRAFLAA